jgi:hypothetical protein
MQLLVAILILANLGVYGAYTYDNYIQPRLGALSVLTASQGGTGIGTATAGDVGDCLVVSDESPLTYTLGACGSGAGDITGGASLGNGVNIFDSESGGILRFNELEAGSNITFSTTSDANTIVISSTGGAADGTFSTTSANFWESTFGNWNLVGTYLTPTTTKGIIVASSTIGDGNQGLTINGTGTTTGLFNVGGTGSTLQGAITPAAMFVNASTTGRSGMILQNYGTGAAPEFRFLVGDPSATLEYLAFGLTNSNASAGGTLFGINKTDLAYIISNSGRHVGIGAGGTGSDLYLSAGDSTAVDVTVSGQTNTSGFLGVGTTTPYARLTVWASDTIANFVNSASTTIFTIGNGGATTTGFAATTLQNCDTIDTDASGNFKCGSDNASAGSGSGTVATSSVEVAEQVAFFTTNGASPALISGDTGFTFNAAGDRLTVTNASTTRLSVNNWVVSTTTTVCSVGCQFSSIQAALDNLPASGGTVFVKNGAYSVTQLLIKQNNTKLIAESQGTIVTCSSSPCVDYNSTGLVHTRVQGFKFDNGNADYTGIGIDTSGALIANIEDNWFDGFATSSSAVDAALDSTFYNEYKNNRMSTTNTCYSFTGAANNNNVIGGRCTAHQANGTRAFGVYVDGATHNVNLFGVNVEPNGGSGASTTAVYVGGASHDILVSGGHYENTLYGVEVSSDSFNVKVQSPYFYSTHTDAWGVCTRAGSTGNSIDTSFITMTAGKKFCDESVGLMVYAPSNRTWLGIGTTTAKGTNANLSLSGAYSTALDPLMWIQNNGAFAAAYSGIGFGNETGGFTNGLGKIGFEPGSGYTDAKFMIHVADAAKALQERLRINVRGWLGVGTSTPYAKLSVWGDTASDTKFFEIANTASTTIFQVNNNGATSTGFAISSLTSCDTLDTDANGRIICGTDNASAGSGSGTVSTSSVETSGRLPFWTTTGATPALLSGGSASLTWDNTNTRLTVDKASTTNLSITNPLSIASGGTGNSTFQTGHIPYGQGGNPLTTEAAFDYDDGINRLNINGSIGLGDTGVILSQNAGTLTLTGQSGTAEDLTVDLSAANAITLTSSTGVGTTTWSGINLVTPLASTTATSTFHGLTFTGKNCSGLANSGKLTLNSLGQVICLDDTSGSGGTALIATSSTEAATQILYWTSTAGTPATISGGENVFAYDSILNKLSVPYASTTDIGATGNIFVSGASSSIRALTVETSTTTRATTTNLYVSGETRLAALTGILKAASGVVSTAVAGVDFINDSFRDWTMTNGVLTPTTTVGIVVNGASSTINKLSVNFGTTTTLVTHELFADASDGILFNASNGTDIAIFGPGNSSNVTFYGGVNIDGATRLATSLSGMLKAASGVVSTAIDGVDFLSPNFRDWSITGGSLAPTSTRGILVQAASSTINGLTINVSTTTSATTTNLSIGGGLTFNGVTADTWPEFCETITGGAGLCDGNDASGGGSFTGAPHALVASVDGSTLSSTSTPNFVAFNATSTTATSTLLGKLSIGSSTPSTSCFFCVGTTSPIFQINSNGQVGFGAVNTGPTKFAFGNGTNANVNPNIMFMVQDTADARMGVSVGDDFVGLKSANGRVGIFGFDYAAGTALDIVMQEFGGKVGIGSTTPTATLSIMPTTFVAQTPLLAIGTSTSLGSEVLSVYASSTRQVNINVGNESGARVRIGAAYNGGLLPLDQLSVEGRINSSWSSGGVDTFTHLIAQIAADSNLIGDGLAFVEDAAAVADLAGVTAIPYLRMRTGATGVSNAVGDGAGIMPSTAYFLAGTSTPVMEVTARIGVPNNATSTLYMIGFTSNSGVSTDYAVMSNTQGNCYFHASSTAANWHLRSFNLVNTAVDTGVASTTAGANGLWYDFRVELDGYSCRGYIRRHGTQDAWTKTEIVGTGLGVNQINPVASVANPTTAGLTKELHINRFKYWWRQR